MSVRVSLRGLHRLICIDTLRRVHKVGFLAGRLICVHKLQGDDCRTNVLRWIFKHWISRTVYKINYKEKCSLHLAQTIYLISPVHCCWLFLSLVTSVLWMCWKVQRCSSPPWLSGKAIRYCIQVGKMHIPLFIKMFSNVAFYLLLLWHNNIKMFEFLFCFPFYRLF